MKSEKGQALILIAFGIVAMLSLTALALDGGNAFADRRHAQNAVDNAALSAALAILNSQNGQTAAESLIVANGYDIASARSTMQYHRPPIRGAYQGNNQYVQVILISNVDTWFANIVGVEQVTNEVEAVARAKPWTPYFDGHAVVSLSPGDGNGNTDEFIYGGSAGVTVSGSGIFSNSSDGCVGNNGNASSLSLEGGGITTVSSCSGSLTGEPYPYPPSFPEFDDLCGRPNAVTINNTNKSFPEGTNSTINDDTIYCISGDFRITNNNAYYSAVNVTFVVEGEVVINGGGSGGVFLSSTPGLPLFYLPYADDKFSNSGGLDNQHNVEISGNANVMLTGLVLAPVSRCNISGGSDVDPLQGQVVCYEVDLGGNAGVVVQYNDSENADDPPEIELTE